MSSGSKLSSDDVGKGPAWPNPFAAAKANPALAAVIAVVIVLILVLLWNYFKKDNYSNELVSQVARGLNMEPSVGFGSANRRQTMRDDTGASVAPWERSLEGQGQGRGLAGVSVAKVAVPEQFLGWRDPGEYDAVEWDDPTSWAYYSTYTAATPDDKSLDTDFTANMVGRTPTLDASGYATAVPSSTEQMVEGDLARNLAVNSY
jgi:hypothetical protein